MKVTLLSVSVTSSATEHDIGEKITLFLPRAYSMEPIANINGRHVVPFKCKMLHLSISSIQCVILQMLADCVK